MLCINSLKIQSRDDDVQETSEDSNLTSEVLTFLDNSSGDVQDLVYSKNPIASSDLTSNTDLATFLSRPTLINSRTWATSDNVGLLGGYITPWYDLLNDPVIKNKIANYAFMRAKLCIKIVINATPFHYGLLRVYYQPSISFDGTGFRTDRVRNNPTNSGAYLVPHSQLPGVWVHPADNSAGTLHIPYFCHTQFARLGELDFIKNLGRLGYSIACPLRIATTTASLSTVIDTFAWFEDVEFSGSTNELLLQAGDEFDGPVSTIASGVAKISSYLDKVPVIGKFAKATGIGASAIASIAGMFGFTNVPVIDPVHSFIPNPAIHLASSEISTPIQKLTLDPKQELSIDPTLHGIGNKDELAISHIITRTSYLAASNWVTSTPVNSVLFNCRVTPTLCQAVLIKNASNVTKSTRVYDTFPSYISRMFTHWRGDIIFDFEVVCTKFHKGRLKVQWDPIGKDGTATLPVNTVYTTIIDIGETNKASLRIPYHQARPFMRCRRTAETGFAYGGAALPCDQIYDNGILSVSVLTPLISPNSPATVDLVIYVKAADNFEFANPAQTIGIGDGICPSFFEVQSADTVDTETSNVVFGDTGSKHPNRYDMNFGERIVSLRTLLHRMSLYDTSILSEQTPTKVCSYVKSYSRLPPSYGYDSFGKSTALKILNTGAVPNSYKFNYSPMHPIAYIGNMFGASRGSVNYTATISNDLYPSVGDVRVQRITTTTITADRVGAMNSGLNNGASKDFCLRYYNTQMPYQFGAGGCIANTLTNGAISWQAPMMNNNLFEYTDPSDSNTGNSWDGTTFDCTYMQAFVKQATANTVSSSISFATYAGTGPDFTLLWLLCCPTVDYYVEVPVPP